MERHADLLKELVANSERNGENFVLTKQFMGKERFAERHGDLLKELVTN